MLIISAIKEEQNNKDKVCNNNYKNLLNDIFKVKEEDSIKGNKYNFNLNDFDEKGNIKK